MMLVSRDAVSFEAALADPADSCDCLEAEAEGTTVAARVRGAGGGAVASFVFDLSALAKGFVVGRGPAEEQSRDENTLF
jgi:hypothetical protein